MNDNLRLGFILGTLIIASGVIGWFGNDIYRGWNNKAQFQGLYLQSNFSRSDITREAYKTEGNADWVCVNVKGIDYKKAIEVCKHEVGHEIFANSCQVDETKCLEAVE